MDSSRAAYRQALAEAREDKKPDSADFVKRSLSAYHPLKLCFAPSRARWSIRGYLAD